jgi:5'-nucleotidase
MPYDLTQLLVIGISSRALFDLEEEDRIFQDQGLQAFIDYQRNHEATALRPGSAFPLVKGLLGLNCGPAGRKVEVILMSRNHPDVSLRVFNSIEQHGLEITRAALTGGAPIGLYLRSFNVGLFLSQSPEDVQAAANQGVAAGLIYPPPPGPQAPPNKIRIAFDGDCVIFSDEAQKIYEKEGVEAFYKYERDNATRALPDGPFAKLLRTLSAIQGDDPGSSPIRVALVTDRNRPAHERVIRTLRAWNVRVDEAFFLGGMAKAEILKAFGAQMFFDDKEEYCKLACREVPTGRVLMPAGQPEVEVTISIQPIDGADSQQRFLLICKSYLKNLFAPSEAELSEWYRLQLQGMPIDQRAALLDELEQSVKGTPHGSGRRAPAGQDTPATKLLTFLENLASKHRST